jgi:hypothetical protein
MQRRIRLAILSVWREDKSSLKKLDVSSRVSSSTYRTLAGLKSIGMQRIKTESVTAKLMKHM